MKYRFTLVVVVAAFSHCLTWGKAVSVQTAKLKGCTFLQSMGASINDTSKLVLSDISMASVGGVATPAYYIFDGIPTGFVIVAATDNVAPVLGYSTTGVFTTANENARAWLTGCRNNIAYAIQNQLAPTAEIVRQWNDLTQQNLRLTKKTSVGPLLTTMWDQGLYYNDLCPYDPIQKAHAVTGCVATAMAQLMKYWNWPVAGCGTHTYRDSLYGWQTINYNALPFQWANMRDSLGSPDTAVAQLMYATGVSVNMEYTVTESGAWVVPGDCNVTNIATFALQTYFHYKHSLTTIVRDGNDFSDSTSSAQWTNMITSKIDAGSPVIYTGRTSAGDGHCWICDGYDANQFLHFHWGWSGYGDGFFNITTGDVPYELTLHQEAILGISPDSFPVSVAPLNLQTPLSTTSSPIAYGQPFSISGKIRNSSSAAFAGDFCAAVFDESGEQQGTLQIKTGIALPAGDSTATLTFSTPGIANLVSGIYSLRIMYRNGSDGTWQPVANNGENINYSTIAIANDTDILITNAITISGDTLAHGQPVTINVGVTSNTDQRNIAKSLAARPMHSVNFDLSLYNPLDGSLVYTIATLQNISIFDNIVLPLTFTDTELAVLPGKYIMELKHQYNDEGAYYLTGSSWMPNPIEVTVGGVTKYDSNKIYVYPNPAKNLINIDPYNHSLNAVRLLDIHGREVIKVTKPVQNSITSISTTNLQDGTYFVELESSGKTWAQKVVIIK